METGGNELCFSCSFFILVLVVLVVEVTDNTIRHSLHIESELRTETIHRSLIQLCSFLDVNGKFMTMKRI